MSEKKVDLCIYRMRSAIETYVATDIFPREIGKKLGRLKQERETSDYDDFYIASAADATEQYAAAEFIITEVKQYLDGQNVQY